MADYRARLFNCPIAGEEFTPTPEGGKIRNLTRFEAGGLAIELVQKPALIPNKYSDLRGKTVETTSLIIRDLDPNRLAEAEAISEAAAFLLSFATSSEVVNAGYDFEGSQPSSVFRSFVGTLQYFRPSISTARSDLLGPFLTQCLPTYESLKTLRALNVVIDYYVTSEQQRALELSLVTIFVLMENLKHTFAKTEGYPFIKGRFRQRGATHKELGKPKSFEDLLAEMFARAGMTPSLNTAIQLRNEIIHSGISELDHAKQWQIYESCQDLVREYIFRLLGYHGEFHRFSDTSGRTVAIIRYHGADYMINNATLQNDGEVAIDMSPFNDEIAAIIRTLVREKQLHALDFRDLQKALANS